MFQGTGASKRAWVIKSRPSRGWDPYIGEYMEWPLEFEEVPKYEHAKHDIIQFISNLIEYRKSMGFGDRAFEELFLMSVKEELPEALSGISRFNGNVDRIFSALTDLVHGDYES